MIMRISKERSLSLYCSAILDPIMALRIENNGGLSIEEMDEKLFKLEKEIWRRVCRELNLNCEK